MRRLDVAALALIASTLLGGTSAVERLTAALEPQLAVSLAWQAAGAGAVATKTVTWSAGPGGEPRPPEVTRHGDVVLTSEGRVALDPWGRPFRWQSAGWGGGGSGGVWTFDEDFVAASVVGPVDEYYVTTTPTWRVLPGHRPRLVTLVATGYLILAWLLLRLRPRATRAREVALALLAVAPLAAVAWALATTPTVTRAAPAHLLVPASLAVGVTLWLGAFLVALALRLHREAT